MPKVKKNLESSSDSDSGPEDRHPVKKAKTETTSSSSSSSGKKKDDLSWELSKNRFVKITEFRGKAFVDIREFYDAGGELKPGKKGISLNEQQWAKFKSIVAEVDEAFKNM